MKHSLKLIAKFVALTLALALFGCGEDSQKNEDPSTPKPMAQAPKPQPAPQAARVVPVSQETKDAYRWYCSQCHGLTGHGDGVNALHLAVPPRNHTKPEYLETRTDRQLFEAIKLGGLAVGRAPCMPAWGHTLNDDAISSLVRYIRELCQCEAA
ncbi:MAG: cytochrome c [Candidatus Nitrohelix vancouverensis]|uniref:Cytochrome c n=1 Tax=Candidatus Nitrohelix vancouverensis TaxID=2705534 RepID=A0A7T0C070_9BACT|nr:MAG: cytochrome c [Candidatus Nitrohelix vancouverensis]